MPTLSASDYTTFLKFKAAAASPIQPRVQLRDNVSLNPSVITANILTSQAAFVVTPTISTIQGNVRVRPVQPEKTNNPNALSTVSWTSGTSGSAGTTSSSKTQQPGGLPAKNVVGTYTRLPQNAGWIQGNQISSGPKRF